MTLKLPNPIKGGVDYKLSSLTHSLKHNSWRDLEIDTKQVLNSTNTRLEN